MQDTIAGPGSQEPAFREIIESLAVGVAFRLHVAEDGRRGRFLHIGSGVQALAGVTAAAVLADGRLFFDAVHPDDREGLREAMRSARESRLGCVADIRLGRDDPDIRWLRVTAAPRRQADGSTVWEGVLSDVTEVRRLREALELERQRLTQAVEVTGLGTFEWSRTAPDQLVWSPRNYEIYGLPADRPVTMKACTAMIHPEDRDQPGLTTDVFRPGPDLIRRAEFRIIRPDGQERCLLVHMRMERDATGLLASLHGTTLDITERRQAEDRRRLQVREMAHRAKNGLTMMQAMINNAARGATTAQELAAVLKDRLWALAKSQDLIAATGGRAPALLALCLQVLEPFDLKRFTLDPGLEEVAVSADMGSGLALLLHELATNALKYGALSAIGGRVTLARGAAPDGRFVLEWRETGGPPVTPPSRRGFGTRLVAAALSAPGGKVAPEFAPEGFRARIEGPTA